MAVAHMADERHKHQVPNLSYSILRLPSLSHSLTLQETLDTQYDNCKESKGSCVEMFLEQLALLNLSLPGTAHHLTWLWYNFHLGRTLALHWRRVGYSLLWWHHLLMCQKAAMCQLYSVEHNSWWIQIYHCRRVLLGFCVQFWCDMLQLQSTCNLQYWCPNM